MTTDKTAQKRAGATQCRRFARGRAALALLTMSILILTACDDVGYEEENYKAAEEARATGDLATAMAIYEELGEYRDSEELLAEIALEYDLARAKQMMAAGDHAGAANLLAALEGYGDSATLLTEARFQAALKVIRDKGEQNGGSSLSRENDFGGSSAIMAKEIGDTISFLFSIAYKDSTLEYSIDMPFKASSFECRAKYQKGDTTLEYVCAIDPATYRAGDMIDGEYSSTGAGGDVESVKSGFLELFRECLGYAIDEADLTFAAFDIDLNMSDVGFANF